LTQILPKHNIWLFSPKVTCW